MIKFVELGKGFKGVWLDEQATTWAFDKNGNKTNRTCLRVSIFSWENGTFDISVIKGDGRKTSFKQFSYESALNPSDATKDAMIARAFEVMKINGGTK